MTSKVLGSTYKDFHNDHWESFVTNVKKKMESWYFFPFHVQVRFFFSANPPIDSVGCKWKRISENNTRVRTHLGNMHVRRVIAVFIFFVLICFRARLGGWTSEADPRAKVVMKLIGSTSDPQSTSIAAQERRATAMKYMYTSQTQQVCGRVSIGRR